MDLRLALLDASHGDPDTVRNFRRELAADLVEFDVSDGDLPPGFAYDGVVVTGSRSSVYGDEPWVEPLVEWLSEAATLGLPVLGVCYGHQALAVALGGSVDCMGEYELGYRTVRHTGDDLFFGVDEEFTVFTSHQDTVVDLPPGAELIAENDYGVHGFRKGHCWGVQFHPEYDAETAERIARGKEKHVGTERVESVLAGVTAENYAAACEAKALFDNFLDYVRRVREEPTVDAGRTAGDAGAETDANAGD